MMRTRRETCFYILRDLIGTWSARYDPSAHAMRVIASSRMHIMLKHFGVELPFLEGCTVSPSHGVWLTDPLALYNAYKDKWCTIPGAEDLWVPFILEHAEKL